MSKPLLHLHHFKGALRGQVALPASKSESNRALIIRVLCSENFEIRNLSDARDTQILAGILENGQETVSAEDAGTVMRFLTAFYAVTGRHCTLTGTARMCERPIGILVEALRQLGAKIEYLGNEGFPPLRFWGFFPENGSKTVQVPGHVSSQFISALLLVAPVLPQGLELELLGQVNSRPYIQMTLAQIQHFGVQAQWEGNKISVKPQPYQPKPFEVEADWSAASYWYSFAALAEEAEISLPNLRQYSLQGDSVVAQLLEPLGVETEFSAEGVVLRKVPKQLPEKLQLDFRNCPDLAQTLLVLCAALKVKLQATGLESLRVKETDRIAALQAELPKFGAELKETSEGVFELIFGKTLEKRPAIPTYKDHRMAMSFAPLALRQELFIEEPEVVQKSYPGFWEELQKVGFISEFN